MSADESSWLSTMGDYVLLEQLGKGATGTVHRARHQKTGRLVAIKILAREVARNPLLLKRFEQEFRITSQLDHPNIVRVLEYSDSDPSPYLVMELIEGESLGEKLDRDGKMPEDAAIHIIVQVAHGLHRAHRQGLIHRDVKPDNILITREGQAKLTDLGVAKDKGASENLTRTGASMGTPDYMAPEQFRNAKNASVQCDVYALAATLYHMVTGQAPFDQPSAMLVLKAKLNNELVSPRKHVPELSERTEHTIMRAMNLEPEKRPRSCRVFVEELTGQSTRANQDRNAQDGNDMWYIIYQDGNGKNRTTKGPTEIIREAIRAGHMGDIARIRCSRSAEGPFGPAREHAELAEHAAAAIFKATDTIRAKVTKEDIAPIAPPPPPATAAPAPPAAAAASPIRNESGFRANEEPQQSGWATAVIFILLGALAAFAFVYFRVK